MVLTSGSPKIAININICNYAEQKPLLPHNPSSAEVTEQDHRHRAHQAWMSAVWLSMNLLTLELNQNTKNLNFRDSSASKALNCLLICSIKNYRIKAYRINLGTMLSQNQHLLLEISHHRNGPALRLQCLIT